MFVFYNIIPPWPHKEIISKITYNDIMMIHQNLYNWKKLIRTNYIFNIKIQSLDRMSWLTLPFPKDNTKVLPKHFSFAQAVAGLGNPVDLLSMHVFMDDYFPARNKFEKQINDWA